MQASIAGEAELPAQTPAVAGVMSKALRLVAIGAIAVGLIIRSVPLLSKPEAPLNTCDGRAYYEMAVSLAQGNGLVINDPFLLQACEGHLTLGPSHHFAPGLPIIEALFVGLLGDGRMALVVPLILLSWLAVAFALWTTNDLYGTDAALLVGAAVSLDWTGSFYGTFLGYSENLVLIVITVTLWAILRAISKRQVRIVRRPRRRHRLPVEGEHRLVLHHRRHRRLRVPADVPWLGSAA